MRTPALAARRAPVRRPAGLLFLRFIFVCILTLLSLPAVAESFGSVRLRVAHVSHPALELRELHFAYEPEAGRARLEVAALRLMGRRWSKLRLDCPQARMSAHAVECRGGRLRVGGRVLPLRLALVFDPVGHSGEVTLTDEAGGRIVARLAPDGGLQATLSRVSLRALAGWLPALAKWQAHGRFDGEAEWLSAGTERVRVRGTLSEGSFSSADGLQAGEDLGLELAVDARARGDGWDWSGSLAWREGASFLNPFYLEAGSVLQASGRLHGERVEIGQASVALDGVERLAATARVDLARAHVDELALSLAGADLARIGPRFLAPLLNPARADELRFAGSVSAGLRMVDGALVELDAAFMEAGFSLVAPAGGGIAFGPVNGHLPWRADQASRAQLRIEGGRWDRLALGGFDLEMVLAGDAAAVERVRVPLLDGAVVLEGLSLRREAAGWRGGGSAFVEPLSMPLLTEALDLPTMAGVLSASLPGVQLRPGEIVLDGALVVSVFDGYLQARGLRVREPFGIGAYLTADLHARHLDLAQLTDTFSFGSISGFIDVDVLGLELARWRPHAFDARIASSAGRYRKRISQRAVQNISALGGAGAIAALQRSLLGLFETFGYRELGLRCVLRGDVCEMSGIEGADLADGGFRIIRGGGLPALDVIGYNRRVDWRELVERLQRVLAENVSPVVR